jgi:hypothetical protein
MRQSKTKTLSGCGLTLFFSIFLSVGLSVAFFMGLKPWLDVRKSQSWIETPCVIRESKVKSSTSDGKTSYHPYVEYSYQAQNRDRVGTQFSFGSDTSKNQFEIQQQIAPYTIGGESVCWVDPQNPDRSVLQRTVPITSTIFALVFGGFFAAFGVGGILLALAVRKDERNRKLGTLAKKNQSSGLLNANVPKKTVDDTASSNGATYREPSCLLPVPEGPDEPLVLKPLMSRRARFVGLAILALVWNALIWILIWNVWNKSPWFVLLFLGVLALAGILILGSAIHAFLQLFNPRTVVVCSQTRIYPGSEFEISWMHEGNTSRVAQLQISIVCEEIVSFQQGTSTRTEKTEAFQEFIVDTTKQEEIAQGFRDFSLPHDVMYSFNASNNKVEWSIKVHGKIVFWADISEVFSIAVQPPEPSTGTI